MPLDEVDEHDELVPPTPLLLPMPLPVEPNPLDNCDADPLLVVHPWPAGKVGTAPVHARYGAEEELGALVVPLPAAAAAAASRCFLFNTNSCSFCLTSEEATALCSRFSLFLSANKRSFS